MRAHLDKLKQLHDLEECGVISAEEAAPLRLQLDQEMDELQVRQQMADQNKNYAALRGAASLRGFEAWLPEGWNAARRIEPTVVTKLPDLEVLAFAVFRTDRKVVTFANEVADHRAPPTDEAYEMDLGRFESTVRRMWDRDESGWMVDAMRRAEEILSVLLMGMKR